MPQLTNEEKAARAAARAQARAMQAALDAEDQHRRSTEARERWEREGMYLTREQAQAGEPCRSCGLPVIDGTGYESKGSMHWTPEEMAEHEAEDAAFAERHRDCRGARWSMSGSRTQHCTECCPPLPLSEGQILELSRILSSVQTRDADLVVWSHTLTCGHEVLSKVHRTDRNYHAHGVCTCSECGDKRGVVAVARVEEPAVSTTTDRPNPELSAAQSEVVRLRSELRAAEAHLRSLPANVP